MTVMMRKCRRLDCDRGVTDLRWGLGYRTCGRHGSEAPAGGTRAARGIAGLWGFSEVHAVEGGVDDRCGSPDPNHECSQAA